MSEENGTGNNLIWAVTTIIVVAIVAAAKTARYAVLIAAVAWW